MCSRALGTNFHLEDRHPQGLFGDSYSDHSHQSEHFTRIYPVLRQTRPRQQSSAAQICWSAMSNHSPLTSLSRGFCRPGWFSAACWESSPCADRISVRWRSVCPASTASRGSWRSPTASWWARWTPDVCPPSSAGSNSPSGKPVGKKINVKRQKKRAYWRNRGSEEHWAARYETQ